MLGSRLGAASRCPGRDTVRELTSSLLRGRRLHSHNPHQMDWTTVPWQALPRPGAALHIPSTGPTFRLLNIFLFDFIENLLVLWGSDPRTVLCEPPDVRCLQAEGRI